MQSNDPPVSTIYKTRRNMHEKHSGCQSFHDVHSNAKRWNNLNDRLSVFINGIKYKPGKDFQRLFFNLTTEIE